jgi:hypothetical protein
MSFPIDLHTERLLLSQWKESDFKPFSKMNACKKVMKYFPQELSDYESNNLAKFL